MKLGNKKLVIFDFDGTLVDSMKAFADIAAKVMHQSYGTPIDIARRQYIETSGLPFYQQLEQIHPRNKKNKKAAAVYEAEKVKGYFDQRVYPDAISTIDYLKKRAFLTAVSSNNFQELVDKFMARSGLDMDYVLGFKTESFCKGRPHFEYLQDKTGLNEDALLFVGDSIKDAERAAEYNIDFIAKTGLFSKVEFRKCYPAIRIINQLDELKGHL